MFATLALAAALSLAPAPAPDPVADCPAGLVCFTLDEYQAISEKIVDLKATAKKAELKQLKRFGFTLGCGVVGYESPDHGGFDYDPGCAAVYGFRFK